MPTTYEIVMQKEKKKKKKYTKINVQYYFVPIPILLSNKYLTFNGNYKSGLI